jgi:hypothetical protein
MGASLVVEATAPHLHLQTLDFCQNLVHPPAMGRLLKRLRRRRRNRELARRLEEQFRGQVDAAAEAAARLSDDVSR